MEVHKAVHELAGLTLADHNLEHSEGNMSSKAVGVVEAVVRFLSEGNIVVDWGRPRPLSFFWKFFASGKLPDTTVVIHPARMQ
jgi:hypothetical protein